MAIWRSNLGLVLQNLGDLAGRPRPVQAGAGDRRGGARPDHPNAATWCNNLGGLLQELGDLAGARAQFERALEIGEAALGPDHPTVATLRNNLRTVLSAIRQEERPKEGP